MLVVKEPFTLEGVSYALGAQIEDPAVAAKALEQAPTHVVRTADKVAPTPDAEPDDSGDHPE